MTHLWKYIIAKARVFFGFEEEDISDRYMIAICATMMIFLTTQIIFSIEVNINTANTIVTIIAFLAFTALHTLSHVRFLRHFTKWAFIIISNLTILGFWITTEGLFGSIISYFPLSLFNVIAVLDRKYHFKVIGGFILCIIGLFFIDIYKPEWIIPYNSLEAKRSDIFSGMVFTGILIAICFRYLKHEFEKNVIELNKQVEEQKRLNEELDNFVYRTSHDLRAPVSSSLGLIELMEMNEQSPENLQYLELQRRSLIKMDDFIRDILHYSRNSRMEIIQDDIDFKMIFEDAVEQIKFAHHAQDMNYFFENEGNISIKSDKMRWQIIFNNIINNAYKYRNTQHANCFLKVTIKQEKQLLLAYFEDNGVGINEASLPKIFDMFYRASTKSIGSGVGLYIVKQSVSKLGGEISCTSTLDKGTTFMICLPIPQVS